LTQTSAQATSTKAKNRPKSRSQRTCSRLKQLSHDSARPDGVRIGGMSSGSAANSATARP
jgi:hypothetical protein